MRPFTPDDVPAKIGGPMPHELPIQLRQLLVMVNGSRSVRELLSMGLRGVELASFDMLSQRGLIHRASAGAPPVRAAMPAPAQTAAPPQAAAPRRRGLSEARFAAIDVLLDLSTQDFAARPWVERMENARSVEALMVEVEAFLQSPLGAKHPGLHATLRRVLG
ncbi:hypothetical protein [Ottowia testudinis]|uniref:Uncharacterized protein n=1 Tax=Ottowia testudinis TaxID=2816950 RepID=A0A975CK71_9BURK|nr:hypothetical protein [Ottowia testudinis]QTD45704.1 hypothetical protein J1M35_01910 [Ottowia testudinis]